MVKALLLNGAGEVTTDSNACLCELICDGCPTFSCINCGCETVAVPAPR